MSPELMRLLQRRKDHDLLPPHTPLQHHSKALLHIGPSSRAGNDKANQAGDMETRRDDAMHDTISITLAWPNKALSPNARGHWTKKAGPTKLARVYATGKALEAIGGAKPKWEGVDLALVFHPPDKRRRDADGMFAMMKASIDGIADALGINDHKFRFTFSVGEPIKGGLVKVTIGERK